MKKLLMIIALMLGASGYAYSMEYMGLEEQIEHDFANIKNIFYAYSRDQMKTAAMRLALTTYADLAIESRLETDQNWLIDERKQYIIELFQCVNPKFTIPEIVQDDAKLLEIDRIARISHRPYEHQR